MKIVRTLSVTRDEFLDYLERELLARYREASDDATSIGAVAPGLRFSLGAGVELRVDEFDRKHGVVATRVTSPGDTHLARYTVKDDDRGVTVVFEQRMRAFENRRCNRLLRGFSEAVYLGRMAESLLDAEEKIVAARAGAA